MSQVLEPPAVDDDAIKQRQHGVWASGDYAALGTTLQIVGETLAEAADLRAGEAVLDIAAGNGNATLAAARRNARVTSTDYVQALLDKGRARAQAEALTVEFRLADAEALPFDDAGFDAVLSTFGVMFTPDQRRAAAEMLRVTRPGGRIAMANWTPGGFIGRLFKLIGAHVPPPPGLASPLLWGTEPHLVELFGARASKMRCERRHFNFRYRSAAHWLQVFRDCYGPMHRAFAALDAEGAAALEREITGLLDQLNIAGPASLVVPAEYLEIVVTRA
ncbi:MAG: class I SAM-dependent methyltransferase [Burkholderiales bacterium]|nr:methyltransferase domain-containing protein [Burkholderiales bacterium]MDE1928637.1 class I SAM-dependent methyltransferase [Burkholderiales bacterium]MDE2160013.1 class I SAM-dependent methyltransferase [Burkholderiales bacterium]MDE2504879.1 class I SAM-dependent methyltransferase [Burkholderiales bacterium]